MQWSVSDGRRKRCCAICGSRPTWIAVLEARDLALLAVEVALVLVPVLHGPVLTFGGGEPDLTSLVLLRIVNLVEITEMGVNGSNNLKSLKS
jgi:hypothetical protein